MVIIDELAYIDQGLWDETIRALLNMKNAGVIGITTPRGPDNFVSLLINMKNEDGTPYFNILHMTTICDACSKLPTLAERMSCQHSWIPTYKSREKQSRNARIAKATGSINITAQEDAGMIVAGAGGVIFDPDQIRQLFDLSNKDMLFEDMDFIPSRIYVISDPNADGESNTTCFSCFWAPPRDDKGGFDRLVILGIDVQKTTTSSQKDLLVLNHIKAIRMMQRYAKVPIIFVPENMTGSYATRCEEIVRNLDSVVVLHEGGPDSPKPGVRKTKEVTADYVHTTQVLMDNAQLVWSSNLFTRSHEYASNLKDVSNSDKPNVDLIMEEMKLEMCRMKYEKGVITGKLGPYQDDMAVSLMMCAYWPKAVENRYSQVYAYYRNLRWIEHQPGSHQGPQLVSNLMNMDYY